MLGCQAGVLFREHKTGLLHLPRSPGRQPSLQAFHASLAALGLKPVIDFVYAAFDDRNEGGHAIYYHGSFEGQVPPGHRILPLAAFPDTAFANPAPAQTRARYANDFRNGCFSIYHGNETSGSMRHLNTS